MGRTATTSLLVGLIVAATAAFAIGTILEGDSEEGEQSSGVAVESAESEAQEEGAEESVDEDSESAEGTEAHEEGEDGEKILGIDAESTPLRIAAMLGSLLLAVGAWLRPADRRVLGVIAAAMFVFGLLDVREVIHQADESNGDVAAIAGLVAVLHLAACAVAVKLLSSKERQVIGT